VIEFKLPELGENIEQGDLVRLMVAPGAMVSAGQSVMELETDKAVVEVPSSVSGTVQEIRVKEGDKIKVGQVIFTVDGAEAKASAAKSAAAAPSAAQPPAPSTSSTPTATQDAKPPQPAPAASASTSPTQTSGATEFKLPELGENISQGDLVRLMISPGTKVSEGQPVMELETDKAVVEVPSSVSGVVKEIKVKEGEKIKVGQVIFTLEGGAAAAPTARPRSAPVEHVSGQHGARLAFQAAIRAEGKTEEQALPPDQPQPAVPTFSMPEQLGKVAGTEHRQPVPAAPHVRRLAREVGVDIYEVKGTGPGGRISEDDVKGYAKALLSAAAVLQAAPASGLCEMGQDRASLDARGAPQDCRAFGRSVEHGSACHPARPRRHH
jgi:pyruvate dehydrogenase E2 component (dihydrolipoyllysine-residue acetyltransferase)